jgi:hypothetical protein
MYVEVFGDVEQSILEVAEVAKWMERTRRDTERNISRHIDINAHSCEAAKELYRSLLCDGTAGAVEV